MPARSSKLSLALLNPRLHPPRNPVSRSIHRCPTTLGPENRSASGKLFEDAAKEEVRERNGDPSAGGRDDRWTQLESQRSNWTGEESMHDAVLRMLVDKYKPLRSGPIRTADQKLKELHSQAPEPTASAQVATATPAPPWQEIAHAPLLPSVEGHRPWHTIFKAPSHAAASIKLGTLGPYSVPTSAESDDGGEHARRTERELAKRKQQAHRLTRARESILDYRFGQRGGDTGDGRASSRISPVNLKGWQNLVEDRIEKARLSGQFDKVEGRGQPIAPLNEERNPFISREVFLLNRIVQRNGAAPPWVEVQMEVKTSVNAFRETLRRSWTRRAIRMLTMTRPAGSLTLISSSAVASLRDREWVERERPYHDTAIAELNSLVRKYNTVAPYAVRRASYSREAELERTYRDCVGEIIRGLNERHRAPLRVETVDDTPQGVGTSPGLWCLSLRWMRGLSRQAG